MNWSMLCHARHLRGAFFQFIGRQGAAWAGSCPTAGRGRPWRTRRGHPAAAAAASPRAGPPEGGGKEPAGRNGGRCGNPGDAHVLELLFLAVVWGSELYHETDHSGIPCSVRTHQRRLWGVNVRSGSPCAGADAAKDFPRCSPYPVSPDSGAKCEKRVIRGGNLAPDPRIAHDCSRNREAVMNKRGRPSIFWLRSLNAG